jgi:pimeloyl-ACP methyl ester carboxylesterase
VDVIALEEIPGSLQEECYPQKGSEYATFVVSVSLSLWYDMGKRGTCVQAFLETLVQENLKVPARVWRATYEDLLEDDSFEELDKIEAPTLILWGDQDAILSRSDQEALAAAIAGSRLVVYPGAGHALYWEEPARFASDLAAFVEGLGK